MANLVVHFEIHASEPQKLIDFYGDLLGWRFTQFGDMPYWTIETGDGAIGNTTEQPGMGINGGLTQREGPAPAPGAPVNGCNIVVGVDGSIDDLVARAVEGGGTAIQPAEDMEGVGRVAYLADPEGNPFGLISPVMSDGRTAMV
ncbi:VOC family protein [Agromyces sp. ZXT2-6]|uniref:VOC family protein n=1 Tax=Agromyces sp. ZXT2-6 TaxID=3461153 RepID=UPI004054AC3F